MNVTNHFLERWVERNVGITTKREINEYIVKNKEKIIEHAIKTFEFAKKIYTGQIGNNITRHYYIKDDMVLVTNTDDNALITTYKIDLGFTDKINLMVSKELLTEIEKLESKKGIIDSKIEEEKETIENNIDLLNENIEILEQQLSNLRGKKEVEQLKLKSIYKDSENIELEIKKHVNTLINSKEYRKDLEKI